MAMKTGYRLEDLGKALGNFEGSMGIDIGSLPDVTRDAIESGQIQKFEFSCELLWKTVKAFLYEIEGVDVRTPKSCMKQFFTSGHVTYEEYELLIQMIDDRNMLSHIYKRKMFKEMLEKVRNYLVLMKKVLSIMENSVGNEEKK
jgi:nucleotidyltransferase substrate binding protein (TIGR01987 family)